MFSAPGARTHSLLRPRTAQEKRRKRQAKFFNPFDRIDTFWAVASTLVSRSEAMMETWEALLPKVSATMAQSNMAFAG